MERELYVMQVPVEAPCKVKPLWPGSLSCAATDQLGFRTKGGLQARASYSVLVMASAKAGRTLQRLGLLGTKLNGFGITSRRPNNWIASSQGSSLLAPVILAWPNEAVCIQQERDCYDVGSEPE